MGLPLPTHSFLSRIIIRAAKPCQRYTRNIYEDYFTMENPDKACKIKIYATTSTLHRVWRSVRLDQAFFFSFSPRICKQSANEPLTNEMSMPEHTTAAPRIITLKVKAHSTFFSLLSIAEDACAAASAPQSRRLDGMSGSCSDNDGQRTITSRDYTFKHPIFGTRKRSIYQLRIAPFIHITP